MSRNAKSSSEIFTPFTQETARVANVTFEPSPFHNVLTVVLKPVILSEQRLDKDKLSESSYSFQLSREYGRMIYDSSGQVQAHVRFCKVDDGSRSKEELPDCLPACLTLNVNGKKCVLPKCIPSTTRPGMLLRRVNMPVNVSTSVACKENLVNVHWCREGLNYAMTVIVIKRIPIEVIVRSIQDRGLRNGNLSELSLIRSILDDLSNGIILPAEKLQFMCPIGFQRMKLPAKGNNCSHIRCFDLFNYLLMNDAKPTWVCPICNNSCPPSDLLVDEFFVKKLREFKSVSETAYAFDEERGKFLMANEKNELPILPAKFEDEYGSEEPQCPDSANVTENDDSDLSSDEASTAPKDLSARNKIKLTLVNPETKQNITVPETKSNIPKNSANHPTKKDSHSRNKIAQIPKNNPAFDNRYHFPPTIGPHRFHTPANGPHRLHTPPLGIRRFLAPSNNLYPRSPRTFLGMGGYANVAYSPRNIPPWRRQPMAHNSSQIPHLASSNVTKPSTQVGAKRPAADPERVVEKCKSAKVAGRVPLNVPRPIQNGTAKLRVPEKSISSTLSRVLSDEQLRSGRSITVGNVTISSVKDNTRES